MKPETVRTIAIFVMGAALSSAWHAQAQDAKPLYPTMAPMEQYLMADRDAEIALARSAAPDSISRDADVLVLSAHGYETAVKGKNGFVCIVQRSWTAESTNPEFWNPKLRGPICYNAAGARSNLPLVFKKTELAQAGKSKEQIVAAIKAGLDKKELPAPELGAMCYMMSKTGYLNDKVGHWHPHLMFYVPLKDSATWGANLPDSPILATDVPEKDIKKYFIFSRN